MDDARELRAAVDLFKLGRYRQDPVTQAIEWDSHLKAMWGLAPDAPVDLAVFISGIHPHDRARVQAALGQSVDPSGDGVCDIEFRVVGVNGDAERWVATRGKTVFEQGRVASFHGVVLDISKRKRAEQTNLTLIAELQHRTRNLLAVVDGLAEQTLASSDSLDDFGAAFRQRLATLSRVQGLFSRAESTPVTIHELVTWELRALGAEPDGGRVTVDGPDVALPNRSVQILALGLHELATNARKHGALRGDSAAGRLRVSWTVTTDEATRRLVLHWDETGIAARAAGGQPERAGVGRTLIEKVASLSTRRADATRDRRRCRPLHRVHRARPGENVTVNLPALDGRRILVIEDEHIVAEALSRCLRTCGAEIVGPAATVEQALKLLETTHQIDGALLDIDLRGIRAYAVADRLIARGVPFVFATGYETTIPERYRHVTVIQKPFDVAETAAALFPVVTG